VALAGHVLTKIEREALSGLVVRTKGPSLLGADGRASIRERESADRTGLAIIETGANAPADFDKPGVYVRPEVYDENRPGEFRCVRTYG